MKQLWNIISLFNDVHINQALKKTHTRRILNLSFIYNQWTGMFKT